MASSTLFIDALLTQIQTTPNPSTLNQTIRAALAKEQREVVLASFISTGQDPLTVLDYRESTLGVLYILSARLHANYQQSPPPTWDMVNTFCAVFNPEHARLAPERVTKLAKGIHRLAQQTGDPALAIQPLRDLILRYPYDPSFLTTIHPVFTLVCASTRNFTSALPVLQNSITDISLSLAPDLHYNDNLTYHYAGGIILAALKRWAEAEVFFELVVTAPGTYPAAIQLEALKKLKLVQLIACGKTSPLPKYTHPQLIRIFKSTAYGNFVNAYPHKVAVLKEIADKEKSLFSQERTLGLIQQAIARAPRWQLKKLTETYITLHLSDIAKAISLDVATPTSSNSPASIEAQEAVRALLVNMIESNDISAKISHEGSVTFSDLVPTASTSLSTSPSSKGPAPINKQTLDNTLRSIQHQVAVLKSLDLEVERSKEYLTRAVKTQGGGGGPGGAHSMSALAMGLGPGGMGMGGFGGAGEGSWDDEMMAAAAAASGQGWDDMYA